MRLLAHLIRQIHPFQHAEQLVRSQIAEPCHAHQPIVRYRIAQQQKPVAAGTDGRHDLRPVLFVLQDDAVDLLQKPLVGRVRLLE